MGRNKPNKPRRKLVTVEMKEATPEQMQQTLDNYRTFYWECVKNLGIPHSSELAEAYSFGIAVGSRAPFYTEDSDKSFVNAMILISEYVSRIPD